MGLFALLKEDIYKIPDALLGAFFGWREGISQAKTSKLFWKCLWHITAWGSFFLMVLLADLTLSFFSDPIKEWLAQLLGSPNCR